MTERADRDRDRAPDDPDEATAGIAAADAASSSSSITPQHPLAATPIPTPGPPAAAVSAAALEAHAHAMTEVSPTSVVPVTAAGPSPRRAASVHHARHSTIDSPPMAMPGALPGAMPFGDDHSHFDGPSSAPPTPSVISITHPSPFIHTHHPRRGSLTPLGLNVISPVAPGHAHQHESSPLRSVGFLPSGGDLAFEPRRDSVASVASNLTFTRPGGAGSSSSSSALRRSSLTPSLPPNLGPPANANAAKRRPSLTPSLPTLAAPSPTRAVVSGHLAARTPASDSGHFLPSHSRTMDSISSRRGVPGTLLGDTRRCSLPHLYYGAWTGPGETTPRATWNPTLPTQRGSVDDAKVATTSEPHIDEGFRFGSLPKAGGPSRPAEDVTAAGSLQRIAQTSNARGKDKSAFEQAEAEEAERQRRAFLAATYGEDSRRARARLSLGGSGAVASPGSPATSTRRQSLLLWERIHKPPEGSVGAPQHPATVAGSGSTASLGLTASMLNNPGLIGLPLDDGLGRRPSLPVGIPMRTPPVDAAASSFDDQNIWDNPDALLDTDERPLPPLLPLSDPVPRLLPSTLALHRATHLLNSRNLEPEPLPAPLPPSLHPPNPVDLSEFDIDFILAGSKSQLGRTGSQSSQKPRTSNENSSARREPVEEEDSFAKFVGAFDDEYGDRRGDWTFRACSTPANNDVFPVYDEPGGPLDPSRPTPRAEWDSHGAGRYEIYPNGDVRSVQSGAVWRFRKTSAREFEFEQPMRAFAIAPPDPMFVPNAPQPLVISPCAGYSLTSKLVHTENGGVKLPLSVQREYASRGSRVSRRFAAARSRQSISEAPQDNHALQQHLQQHHERIRRIGSEDSDATALPISNNKRHSSAPGITPRLSTSSPPSVSPPKEDPHHKDSHQKRAARNKKDPHEDDKKKSSLSGVLKRGLFRASNLVKDYEDRKERSHLWSNGHGHKNNASTSAPASAPAAPERPTEHRSDSTVSSLQSQQSNQSNQSHQSSQVSQDSSAKRTSESDELADWPDDAPFGSLGLGIEDEQNGGQPWKEGKAWSGVPEDAVAMVIPIETEKLSPPPVPSAAQPFINPFFVDGPRQALLVWFSPFNATTAPPSAPDSRFGSTSTLFKINESPNHENSHSQSPSLARLPKILRPRALRAEHNYQHGLGGAKHIPVPPPTTGSPDIVLEPVIGKRRESRALQPLPFRAFRIVAKVVDTEDLRSEPEVPVIALEQWTEQLRTGKPASPHTPPLEGHAQIPVDAAAAAAASAAVSRSPSLADNGIMSGRAFPTVVAVCHSYNTGVEFVLEGLDRLGLCKGESAWGPTGYEEWRGTGLSENGRQLLDLLWSACSAVMGL